jgi:hypothetical protein
MPGPPSGKRNATFKRSSNNVGSTNEQVAGSGTISVASPKQLAVLKQVPLAAPASGLMLAFGPVGLM